MTFEHIAPNSIDLALNLACSLNPNLSPAAARTRDRFRDLVGFKRGIVRELGHAVVAAHLLLPLVRVTIEPDGDLRGACHYAVTREDLGNNDMTARMAVSTSAGRVAVATAIAGYDLTETEFACSIDSHHDEYAHDDRLLRSLALRLNVAYEPWARKVISDAWHILALRHVWSALMALAPELKRERTISGDRVRQVLAEGATLVG